MLAILVYRLWSARGGDKRLFVVVMAVYYAACMLFIYATITGDSVDGVHGSDEVDGGRRPHDEPSMAFDDRVPSSAIGVRKRGRFGRFSSSSVSVEERWSDRRLHLRRYCSSLDGVEPDAGDPVGRRLLLLAPRRRLSSCILADTPHYHVLTSLLRLASVSDSPESRPERRPLQLLESCRSRAQSRGLLVDPRGHVTARSWRHVLLVMEPSVRLALSYLTDTWPCSIHVQNSANVIDVLDQSGCNFTAAVDQLLSTVLHPVQHHVWRSLPDSVLPIVSGCDVCRRVDNTFILHVPVTSPGSEDNDAARQRFDEEFSALVARLALRDVLSVDIDDMSSVVCAPSAPLMQQARYLVSQLSERQLLQIRNVYSDDLQAFPRELHSGILSAKTDSGRDSL